MFSIAVALPTCFDFNEVEEAIARFSEADTVHGGAYWAAADVWTGHFRNWGWWNWTTKQMTMASVMLGSSVLTVILIYLSLTATTFKDPLKRDSPVLLKKWWDWTKFGIIYAFGNLIIGTVSLFNSIQGLYFLKFPDHYIQRFGEYADDWRDQADSPTAYYNSMSLCNLIAGVLVMGVVVPGVGLARKNREAHGLWVAERSSLNRSEIRQVLEGLGPLAAEHVRRFEDAEITPDLLVDLSWEQLTSIGVPLGHAIKLHRAFATAAAAKKPDSEAQGRES